MMLEESPKKLRRWGFFEELEHGSRSSGRLKDLVHPTPHSDQQSILKYLETAPIASFCPTVCIDVLDPKNPVIGPENTRTDGEWAWPQDLAFYVRKYNIRLPEAFVAHMRERNWKPPPWPPPPDV